MLSWLRRIFGRGEVEPLSPIERIYRDMQAKDPQLAAEIGSMQVIDGYAKWRQKYPDDLASEYVKDARIN